MFSNLEIKKFAAIEVCADLIKATNWGNAGQEEVICTDRPEPWYGLARPIQNYILNMIRYYPELCGYE